MRVGSHASLVQKNFDSETIHSGSYMVHMSQDESCDQNFFLTIKNRLNFIQTFILLIQTRKNAQVVTSLQTSCYTSVHKLSTSCVRTACSQFVVTSLKQAVNNL
jgi:hypothetical protein